MKSVDILKGKYTPHIIASIPHGSSNLTSEMIERMEENVILTNNDWFLNELYSFLPKLNITKISPYYSRYVIDVNRSKALLDCKEDYTKTLIYHHTTFGKKIYKEQPLPENIINMRINHYNLFHETVLRELESTLKAYGKAYLFDLHSFYQQSDADVVLGTNDGKTCSQEILDIVYNAFISEEFTVKINEKGLRGGFIVTHYSNIPNVETIQIELRYTTYIGKRFFGEEEVKNKDQLLFDKTQNRLYNVFNKIKKEIEIERQNNLCRP